GAKATISAVTTIIAVDRQSRDEARENTSINFDCNNPHQCVVKTVVPPLRSPRWSSSVKYTVRVPKTVHVRVLTTSADQVHVSNIMGNVTARAFTSPLVFANGLAAPTADSTERA